MGRTAAPIWISDQERVTLQSWAKARSQAQRVFQRAQIIQLAAAGAESKEIVQRLRVSRPSVQLWRERFLALPRSARVADEKVAATVEATLHSQPPNATHWSTRTSAVDAEFVPKALNGR